MLLKDECNKISRFSTRCNIRGKQTNTHKSAMLYPLHRWQHQGQQRLRDLPKDTWLGGGTGKVKPLPVQPETDGTSMMPRWPLPLPGFSADDVAQVIFLEILWKQLSDYTTCNTQKTHFYLKQFSYLLCLLSKNAVPSSSPPILANLPLNGEWLEGLTALPQFPVYR